MQERIKEEEKNLTDVQSEIEVEEKTHQSILNKNGALKNEVQTNQQVLDGLKREEEALMKKMDRFNDFLKDKATELGITNIRYVDKTVDDVRISKFYNTIDVLAHSRKDGEINPANVWEAFAHGKPVVSHYAHPFNGHIEVIRDCGFVVLKGDVNEYARIMKKFINKEIDYFKLSEKCINNWQETCIPDIVSKLQLEIYKELLNE